MSSFNYIPGFIGQMQKEVGFSNQTGFFETAAYESSNIINERRLWIDVYYSETGVAEVRKAVQVLKQAPADQVKYHFLSNNNFHSVQFPSFFTPVAILIIDEDFLEKNYLLSWYSCRNKQYKAVWVFNFSDNEKLEREIALKAGPFEKYIYTKANNLTEVTELLNQVSESFSPQEKDVYVNLAIAQSLEPLFAMMQEIIARESNILQTRKLLNTLDNQIIRKEETQINNTEIVNYTKQVLQKSLGEMEKTFRQKYDDLNKPNIGFFAVSSASFVGQITTLQYEELAEKSEKFQTTLPTEVIDSFLQENEANLLREFNKDKAYAETIIADLIHKINSLLSEKLKTTIAADFSAIQFVSKERILKSSNYIQRLYIGETTKKGAMEYFVALRDYTGLMMVVVGLLAPLNMIASAGDGTIGGPVALFLKSIANWVKLGTAIITATLIGYGIHDLRRRIPRKRKEEIDREIGKAKENILQEGKRIYGEASRDWVQNISAWIKDISTQISMEVDKIIKNSTDKKHSQLASEKNSQAKNQQVIDNALRNIQTAERTLGTTTSKFLESKQLLKLAKQPNHI